MVLSSPERAIRARGWPSRREWGVVGLFRNRRPTMYERSPNRLVLEVLSATGMDICRPSKILIIEDNAIDREVYKRCLWESTTWGFEFAEADSATAGIEMAKTWQPDCALLDVNLPDMNGIEALA